MATEEGDLRFAFGRNRAAFRRGFALQRLVTAVGGDCNEFVFARPAA